MKVEAAMEARFLQLELEQRLAPSNVFLDSDDLRSLDKLVGHVQRTRCLVLMQTRSVLTRPFCLLELLAAIDAGIPLVGVTVEGRPEHAYDFEVAADFLSHLDVELERVNPGATDVLAEHGVTDLVDAARKLSSVVPQIISVKLSVGASRRVLAASIDDIADAMQSAVLPTLPDPTTWQPPAKRPSQHGAPAPPKVAPPPPAAAPVVPSLVGQATFAAGREHRELQPVALLLQMFSSAAAAASAPNVPDAHPAITLMGACGEKIELLLLAAQPSPPPAAWLKELADALEAATNVLHPLRHAANKADETKLRDVATSLQRCAAGLTPTPDPQSLSVFARAVEAATPAAAAGSLMEELQALRAELDRARSERDARQAESNTQALVAKQNEVLREQMEQMSILVESQRVSMQRFMAAYPQAPDEGERRIVVENRRLMELEIPNLSLDNALRNVHMAGWFDGLSGLMVKLIDAKVERMVSCCFRDEKGPGAKFGGLICMSDFKGKDLNFFLSKAGAPRKASGAG